MSCLKGPGLVVANHPDLQALRYPLRLMHPEITASHSGCVVTSE